MTPDLPPLTFDPRALSAEHLLLRGLNQMEARSLSDVLTRLMDRHPDFTRLGQPYAPTAAARNAWVRISEESWTAVVSRHDRTGLMLTEAGVRRLELFWEQQVLTPYLRRIRDEYGEDAMHRAARELR